MKLLIDACVLYPTVMREVVLGVAATGAATPLWSPRILEEWARAARKIGPEGEAQARAEIALIRAAWPDAEITPREGLEAQLYLPDPNDLHVLAAAITGGADAIMTLNARDFPRNLLAEWQIARIDPDSWLYEQWLAQPEAVAEVGARVLAQAQAMSPDWTMRPLLKKARLPRLAKALA